MPSLSVTKLIGHTLFARKKLTAYNYPDKPNKILFYIQPNGSAGNVYSYLERNDGIWLMFNRVNGGYYYIKYESDSFKLTQDIQQEVKLEEIQNEQELIKQQGAIPYYIDKYGKIVLFSIIGVIIITTIIKTKK